MNYLKYILERVAEKMPVAEYIVLKNKGGRTALEAAQNNVKRYSTMTEEKQEAMARLFKGDSDSVCC